MSSESAPPPADEEPLDRTEQVLLDALSSRSEFDSDDLERLCREHPDLARSLRSAYAGFAATRQALHELSAAEHGTLPDPGSLLAGRFRPLSEIGRGGMSIVFSAWDQRLRRKVALKCVRAPAGLGTPASSQRQRRRARLVNEAQVLAQLDHPGVVPLYDIVQGREDEVYVAMQRVRGVDLRAIFRRCWNGDVEWGLPRVVSVLQRVCEAVAYAHGKGVLHRDLKPANVMVGSFGEAFVMDWGLARTRATGRAAARLASPAATPDELRALPEDPLASLADVITDRDDQGSPTSSELYTLEGEVLGTPCYMSPEQASGRLDAVDARSDVYSVGAMLYELLARHPPYLQSGESRSSTWILTALRSSAPDPIGRPGRQAPAELAAIVEKAMARDREQRYAGMRELADELRAFLEGRVVRAHRTGALVELRKWIARNRLAAAALALVVAVLLALGVAQDRFARRLSALVVELREREYRNQMGLAAALLRAGDAGESRRLLDETAPQLRGWEWHCLARQFERSLWSAQTGQPWTMTADFSPDGTRLAVVGGNKAVYSLWDARNGALLARSAPHPVGVNGLVFTPAGDELLVVGDRDQVLALDARTLEATQRPYLAGLAGIHHGLRHFDLRLDPIRQRLLVASEDGRVSLWDTRERRLLRVLDKHDSLVRSVRALTGRDQAVTVSGDGTARVWDCASGELLLQIAGHGTRIDGIAIAPDERHVALADQRGNVWVCDLESGERTADVARLPGGVPALCWSSTLPVLLAASGSMIRVFDTQTWSEHPPLVGHLQTVLNLTLAPDGKTLASVSIDGGIRVWDLERLLRPSPVSQHPGVFDRIAFDPLSAEFLLIHDHGEIEVWDPQLATIRRELGVPGIVRDSELAPDGGWLASVAVSGAARITDLRSGEVVREFLPAPERYDQCSVLRGHRRVFLATVRGRLSAWDLDSSEPLWSCAPVGPSMDAMVLSPDARRLLLSSAGTVACVEAASGRVEWTGSFATDDAVVVCDVSSDGQRALLRSSSGIVQLVDLDDGAVLWSHSSLGGLFGRGDGRLFVPSAEGDLAVVDARSGERIANLPGRAMQIALLAVSPDGQTLVAVGADGRPEVWSGAPLETRPTDLARPLPPDGLAPAR